MLYYVDTLRHTCHFRLLIFAFFLPRLLEAYYATLTYVLLITLRHCCYADAFFATITRQLTPAITLIFTLIVCCFTPAMLDSYYCFAAAAFHYFRHIASCCAAADVFIIFAAACHIADTIDVLIDAISPPFHGYALPSLLML